MSLHPHHPETMGYPELEQQHHRPTPTERPSWDGPSFDGFAIPERQASQQAHYVIPRSLMDTEVELTPAAKPSLRESYLDDSARGVLDVLVKFVNAAIVAEGTSTIPTITHDGRIAEKPGQFRTMTATKAVPPLFPNPTEIIETHDLIAAENRKTLAYNLQRQAANQPPLPYRDMNYSGYFTTPLAAGPAPEGLQPIAPVVQPAEQHPAAPPTTAERHFTYSISGVQAPTIKAPIVRAPHPPTAVAARPAPAAPQKRDINREPQGYVDQRYTDTFTRLEETDIISPFFDEPVQQQPRLLRRIFRKLFRKS